MSRMPCSVTDDPLWDRSDWEEGKGAYATKPEPDPDYERDRMIDEELLEESRRQQREKDRG